MEVSVGLCLILLLCFGFSSAKRSFNYTINPGCPLTNCFVDGEPFKNNLVYVISKDTDNGDDYRIFWSTIKAPTILITHVANVSEIIPELAWTEFAQDNTPETEFLQLWERRYAGMVLSKLIEFEDGNDTADLNQATNFTEYDLARASWYPVDINQTDDQILGRFTGTYGVQKNNITIEVRAHGTDGRADNPPRMLVQPSSVSFRLILNNFTTAWNKSRFALEMVFASNDSSHLVATHSEIKTVSDENSPGIFTIEQVSGADTYLQWKPIVYTKNASPGVSDSTRSQTGSLKNISHVFPNRSATDNDHVPYSLLIGLRNLNDANNTLVRFNVTLGLAGDGFYAATGYQEWNFEIGLGQPPVEGTSNKVKLIIAVGFGIPAALILFGGIYVVYIRIKRKRQGNQLIQEPSHGYNTLGQ